MPRASSAMACGWSPRGSYSETSWNGMPALGLLRPRRAVRHEHRQAAGDERVRGEHRLALEQGAGALGALVRAREEGVERGGEGGVALAGARRGLAQRGERTCSRAACASSLPRLAGGEPSRTGEGRGGGDPERPPSWGLSCLQRLSGFPPPLTPPHQGEGDRSARAPRGTLPGAPRRSRASPASRHRVSTGGGAGLPERRARGAGRGVASDLGGRAIARNMARAAKRDKPSRTPRPVLRRRRVRKGPISSNGEATGAFLPLADQQPGGLAHAP